MQHSCMKHDKLFALVSGMNNLMYFKFYSKGFKLIDGSSKRALIFLPTREKHFYKAEWQKTGTSKGSRGCVAFQRGLKTKQVG